jgi:hypothetical protein
MLEIPRQALLIKLLGLTGSSSDHEALSAIRKANELLKSSGWTWEDLILSRIKIIADPFSNLRNPLETKSSSPRDHIRQPAPTPSPNGTTQRKPKSRNTKTPYYTPGAWEL